MTKDEFDTLVNSNDAIMFYFSGNNCGVCNILKPKIKELLDKKYPNITQQYIEAENSKQLCAKLSIFSVPVILIYFDKKEFIRKNRNFSILEVDSELKRPYRLFFS